MEQPPRRQRGPMDDAGWLTMSYGNDPFGQTTYTSGLSNNPFRYTGQYLDNQTGMYYLRARYYQPATGRFTSPDTIMPDWRNSQALNYYAYVHNNPLEYIDPSGHFLNLILGAIGGAIGGAAYGYGSQVVDNLGKGMSLGDALTTNIDRGKVAFYTGVGATMGTFIGPVVAWGVSSVTGAASVGTTTATATSTVCQSGRCQEGVTAVGEAASNVVTEVGQAVQIGQGAAPTSSSCATAVTSQLGRLQSLGGGNWLSSEGLIYRLGSKEGNRVLHVLAHASPDSSKAIHTVFNVGRNGVLALIDEAWAMRGAASA